MRVKLLNIYASPKGTFHAGQVIELDPHEAQQLIAGRYAEPAGLAAKAGAAVAAKVEPPAKKAAAKETAQVKQPETRTAAPKAAKKPKAEGKPKVEPPKPQ